MSSGYIFNIVNVLLLFILSHSKSLSVILSCSSNELLSKYKIQNSIIDKTAFYFCQIIFFASHGVHGVCIIQRLSEGHDLCIRHHTWPLCGLLKARNINHQYHLIQLSLKKNNTIYRKPIEDWEWTRVFNNTWYYGFPKFCEMDFK